MRRQTSEKHPVLGSYDDEPEPPFNVRQAAEHGTRVIEAVFGQVPDGMQETLEGDYSRIAARYPAREGVPSLVPFVGVRLGEASDGMGVQPREFVGKVKAYLDSRRGYVTTPIARVPYLDTPEINRRRPNGVATEMGRVGFYGAALLGETHGNGKRWGTQRRGLARRIATGRMEDDGLVEEGLSLGDAFMITVDQMDATAVDGLRARLVQFKRECTPAFATRRKRGVYVEVNPYRPGELTIGVTEGKGWFLSDETHLGGSQVDVRQYGSRMVVGPRFEMLDDSSLRPDEVE